MRVVLIVRQEDCMLLERFVFEKNMFAQQAVVWSCLHIAKVEAKLTISYTVWQIAVRDYRFGKGKHSSLTKATYDAVGNKFRSLWGKEAGWAHSVLFTADLKSFSERLVSKVEKIEEIDGVVKTEVKIETDDVDVPTSVVKKEVKVEEEEVVRGKSRKRKATTVLKSEFVLESTPVVKSEPDLNESMLEGGSMLDRVKRRRRAK